MYKSNAFETHWFDFRLSLALAFFLQFISLSYSVLDEPNHSSCSWAFNNSSSSGSGNPSQNQEEEFIKSSSGTVENEISSRGCGCGSSIIRRTKHAPHCSWIGNKIENHFITTITFTWPSKYLLDLTEDVYCCGVIRLRTLTLIARFLYDANKTDVAVVATGAENWDREETPTEENKLTASEPRQRWGRRTIQQWQVSKSL
jgi:hypothetical protein